MYELIRAGASTWYFQCPAKIGVWRANERDVYLIDSGGDKDAGRSVLKILNEQGWRLKGILNTHSNADHVGGNRYLQDKTGCKAFACGAEAALTRRPLLEPSLIYGGYPFRELRGKFLMAKPSDALDIGDEAFPKEIEVIPLPGHFIDMVGFRTPDDVVFLADCIASRETIQKYGVTFLYDVGAQLKTLDMVEQMEAAMFVPAHAEASADVKHLVRVNRLKILEIADRLLELCRTPMMFEDILQGIFAHHQLTMNAAQYVLVGSTVRSYLSWLRDTGRLTIDYTDNKMLWTAMH
ncbi:MAG: MBL fold metallo-hydrolase [Clostridiales bacterium]|nr:MBL fold metallo-hydrolase [Clostridiales bacterium]